MTCVTIVVLPTAEFELGSPHRDVATAVSECMESTAATDESTIKVCLHTCRL